jgi:hypothetical protein
MLIAIIYRVGCVFTGNDLRDVAIVNELTLIPTSPTFRCIAALHGDSVRHDLVGTITYGKVGVVPRRHMLIVGRPPKLHGAAYAPSDIMTHCCHTICIISQVGKPESLAFDTDRTG